MKAKLIQCVSEKESLSKRKQCDLLGVTRGTVYYKPKGEKQENLDMMRKMDEYHLEYPTHGVIRMQDYLRMVGFSVNHKRVRRLMWKMGLKTIYPKRNLSKLGQAKYKRPYLLRGLSIDRPNQVWAIDITYIPMKRGFMYLTAIMDIYSRYIVAWDISNTLEAESCLNVLKNAISLCGKPEIINSDQGSQFTCELWTSYVENQGIRISMDGKGRALDNVYIERFWRSVKHDHVYLNPANNGSQLHQGLCKYIDRYNHVQTHQGINRCIPAELYKPAA